MKETITRQEANDLLHKYVTGEHYITHSYTVETIMRSLAEKLAPNDIEFWGICGLLHDLDEETCDWRNDLSTHGPGSVKILRDEGYDIKTLEDAICAHNPTSGVIAHTTLQYAILAADPMSGFIKAVAQIYPDKKVASVKPKSVKKRFNESRFAKGANRQYMMAIEETGISYDDFIPIALNAMIGIADEIGL